MVASNGKRFEHLAKILPPAVSVEYARLHQSRHRSGCGVANRDGLDDVLALEHVANAVEEIERIDLLPVVMKEALYENRHCDSSDHQQQPHHGPAMLDELR